MGHGRVDHGLAGVREVLVVLAQPAVPGQPRERALDHPPPRVQFEPLAGGGGGRDIPAAPPREPDEPAAVTAVGDDLADATHQVPELPQQPAPAPVLDVRRRHAQRPDEAERVDRDVPLAAQHLFPPSHPRSPPRRVVFTVWLSTRAVRGIGGRPASSRQSSRSAAWAFSRVPSSRQARKFPYTVCHGGKSCGSGRHAAPACGWWKMASATPRRSAAGRPPLGVPRPRPGQKALPLLVGPGPSDRASCS